jgi:hypothetical protein
MLDLATSALQVGPSAHGPTPQARPCPLAAWRSRATSVRTNPLMVGEKASQPFETGREAMPRLLLFDDVIAHYPVELNGTTGTLIGLVPMPRVIRPPKDEKRAVGRGDLGHMVLEIRAAPQQAEAASFVVPTFVEIEEDSDDLGLAVCVDRSVLLLQVPAHSAHGGSLSEIDPKLLFHSFAKLGALQLLKQGRKMSFDLERVRRM